MRTAYKPLTSKQESVLHFIIDHIKTNGYPPTLQETADFLETANLSTAQYYVETLRRKGHLNKLPHESRGISLVGRGEYIPLQGVIKAGQPIEQFEIPDEIKVPDTINLDKRYPHYALKVSGDSMKDMGIFDGDIAIIRHQFTAEKGDTVVAITETGATLKILDFENGHPVLIPRNNDYKLIRPKELEIRGKFIGLLRHSG